jgi:hypothetical protein
MYGYEDSFDILPDQLLQKITAEEIFKWIFNDDISTAYRYISPFRDDSNPDCRFQETLDGTLLFIDFGERNHSGRTHRTCWRAVMDYHKCSLSVALKLVSNHFGLSNNPIDYVPLQNEKNEAPAVKVYPTLITWDVRPIEKRDKIFWSQFIISSQDLKDDKVGIVKTVHIDSMKGKKSFDPMSICYAYDFGHHVKIYQPYNNPKYKWITNCNENDIGNLQNIPLIGDELIISKAYKDHRVLRNIGFGLKAVVWTPNEGSIPCAKILLDLSQRFPLITIFYDNDQPGRDAAAKLMAAILTVNPSAKVRCIWLPVRKFPHKDPSDFIKKEGRADTQEVLKYIGISPKIK